MLNWREYGRYLSTLNLEGWTRLVIQSESISNKSLRTLMKNYLPSYISAFKTPTNSRFLFKALKNHNHTLPLRNKLLWSSKSKYECLLEIGNDFAWKF